SLAWSLTSTRIGVRTLSADRQVAAMTISAIRTDFDQPLDVHLDFFAQIAFHQTFFFDHGTNAVDFIFAKVLDLLHRVHFGRVQNAVGTRRSDAVDVGQRDVGALVARE